MKNINGLAITLLAMLLLTVSFAVLPVRAPARSDAVIMFYLSQEAAYAALKANDVDFMQEPLTHEQRLDAEADPNLCVAAYDELGVVELDLNNNYTVPGRNPGVRNPLNLKEFRQAMSCAVDKQYIVEEMVVGELVNVPIPPSSSNWWNSCLYQENFAWKYDMTKAAELLDAAGFVDREPDGIRNYPIGWDGAEDGGNMNPLYVCIRTEDIIRYYVGLYFCDQLDILGVPYTQVFGILDELYPIVMGDLNYHVYTGSWSLGRYPTDLYTMYHSDFWLPYGSNYVTGMNKSNLPNYPKLDNLLHDIYYTSTIYDAYTAVLSAGGYGWCDLVVNIPLWSYTSYVAWSRTLAGVVNGEGYGFDNSYHFLNAYKTGGGPIRMAIVCWRAGFPNFYPKSLNQLYTRWKSDYGVLDRVFDTLLSVHPYVLTRDQPWAVQDWEVGTWVDPNPGPGEPSTKNTVTYYLRTDVGIAEPVTGGFVRNLSAHDLEFSCWYTYAFDDGWNWNNYKDVHHSEIIDDYTIKYYFDDASYWFYTAPQYPIFAKTELIDQVCGPSSVSFYVDGVTSGTEDWTYKFTADQVVEVTSANIDGIPLTEGVDFEVFAGYEDYEHNWIWFFQNNGPGTVTINYYTPDVDPHGYYLAGLPWQETWYGFGPFYVFDMVWDVCGNLIHATMNKNPHYFWGTPPLGELDWYWYWEAGGGPENPGRDTGYFKIDIYDVVKAAASYCHRGDGDYDPHYFPGADLEPTDLGHIGIYDIVTITGIYGLKWGQPPPYP